MACCSAGTGALAPQPGRSAGHFSRAISLGSSDHLGPVCALTWANVRPVLLPGSAAFTVVPRCSPLVLVQ
jgi:hypothetical protein